MDDVPLEVDVERRADALVVMPRGDVDTFSVAALEAALHDAALQPAAVVVDLDDVRFMDLRGVRAIVQGAGEVAARGGRLRVDAATPTMARMFELFRLPGAPEVRRRRTHHAPSGRR